MTRRTLAALLVAVVASIGLVSAPAGADSQRTHRLAQAKPTRIVSLSPTATEMLYAIGAGRQVKAVDDQSDYPKNAPKTDLSGFNPNVEAIAAYRPDLVVMSDNSVEDRLKQLGIKVLVQPAAANLNQSYAQIRALGKATGRQSNATRLVDTIKSGIADVKAQVPKRSKKVTVYYELDDTYFSATSKTFIGQVLSLAGLSNIADQAQGGAPDYPQLTSEYIVSTSPDYIFLADGTCCGQTPEVVAARPGWANITAVRDKHVFAVNDDLASRWGPRVVDLLRTIVNDTKQ
jgi:iron complex transport system substrate-binding protein